MTEPTTWRILSVEEDNDGLFKVTAVSYDPAKYCYIERGEPLDTRVLPDLTTPPSPPATLTLAETYVDNNGTVAVNIFVSWASVTGVSTFRIRWRLDAGAWSQATAYDTSYDITGAVAGTYDVEVYSINAFGIESTTAAADSIVVGGVGTPPGNPTGLNIVALTDSTATLSWTASVDFDVTTGGQVLIRHDPRTVGAGATWANANPIVAAVPGSATSVTVPLLTGTYWVAFKDQSGQRSPTPASVYTTAPAFSPARLAVKTWSEEDSSPVFDGTKTNVAYNGGYLGLFLNAAVSLAGEYVFKDTFDLGGVYSVKLRRDLVSRPEILSGSPPTTDVVAAKTYFRTTNTDPTGVATWSAWTEFSHAIATGRGIQIKATLESTSALVGQVVSQLGTVAELQQRTAMGEGTGNSVYNVTYPNAFYQTPSVSVTGVGMAPGDYSTVSASTRTGFTVSFFDSGNNPVTRGFTYTATGFGSQA